MKKILLLLSFLFVINVNASCTVDEKANLKTLVNKVELKNILIDYEEDGASYDIFFLNLSDELYVNTKGISSFYLSTDENGNAYAFGIKPGNTIRFDFYGKSTCKDEVISSKTQSFPYFNEFSKMGECIGIEDFELCASNLNTSNLNYSDFVERVQKYKTSLEEKLNEDKIFSDKILSFLSKYYYYILYPIIILSAVGIIVIKSREKKGIL